MAHDCEKASGTSQIKGLASDVAALQAFIVGTSPCDGSEPRSGWTSPDQAGFYMMAIIDGNDVREASRSG
jgi:hypothetical protein